MNDLVGREGKKKLLGAVFVKRNDSRVLISVVLISVVLLKLLFWSSEE